MPTSTNITREKILLANSPIFIKYTRNPVDYSYIKVKLYVWSGELSVKPIAPTFELVAYKNNIAIDTTAIEISDYLSPFLDPKPTKDFFSGIPGNFNEFINFQYQIDSYVLSFDNSTSLIESITSDVLFACLGYGYVSQGAMPVLDMKYQDGQNGIDSSTVTIDSTYITIDSDGKVIENSKRISVDNLKQYNAQLNYMTSSSSGVITRSLTNFFKPICTKGYKPRQIMFLNKNGLLDLFTFPRVSTQKLKYTSDKYNRTASLNNNILEYDTMAWNYKMTDNFNTIFNKNGNQEWIFNTDNLDEYNVSVIEELYASDRHWLVDYDMETFIPLQLTDDTFEKKTAVKDRAKMNFTIRFIESNDYIQNIR